MAWSVGLHDDFQAEFDKLPDIVQDELLARMALLKEYGPTLGRPHADTLQGSKHANLKELRFKVAGGVWRITYAVDPDRCVVLLAAGDKSGVTQRLFYRRLIARSDRRFSAHLARVRHERDQHG